MPRMETRALPSHQRRNHYRGLKCLTLVPTAWHVIVAMLGVLKAGGAYMPVNPDFLGDRIAYMLRTAGSRIALLYGYGERLPELP